MRVSRIRITFHGELPSLCTQDRRFLVFSQGIRTYLIRTFYNGFIRQLINFNNLPPLLCNA